MSTQEEQKKDKPQKDTLPFKPPMSKIALSAFILSLLSFIFLLGFYKLYWHQQQELHAQFTQLEKNHQNQLHEIKEKTETQYNALNHEIQTNVQQHNLPNQHWLLLKARYYLELAQIQAHWGNTNDLINALLQEADKTLSLFHEPQALVIRQAIAKDIAAVQNAKPIDSAGILSQLDAAQKSLSQLKMLNKNRFEATLKANSSETNDWHSHLENSLTRLSQLIVIRHHDEQQAEPLISPLLEDILKEKIALNLQEAQWAVLHENDAVYQLTLSQAIRTLKKHFGDQDHLMASLNHLQTLKVQQQQIPIGEALPLLNQWIQKTESPAEGGLSQ